MKPMGTPQRTDDLIASYSSKGPDGASIALVQARPRRSRQFTGRNGKLQETTLEATEPRQLGSVQLLHVRRQIRGHRPTTSRLSGTSMAAGRSQRRRCRFCCKRSRVLQPDQVEGTADEDGIQKHSRNRAACTIPRPGIPTRASMTSSQSAPGYLDIAAALASTDVGKRGGARSPIAKLRHEIRQCLSNL